MTKTTFFASCPRETETYLLEELKSYEVTNPIAKKGGVQFEAPVKEAINFMLHSRIASRAFMELKQFSAKTQDDVYESCLEIEWNKMLNPDQTFKIQTLFDHKAIGVFKNSLHMSLRVKDALCDQYRKAAGSRPSVDKSDPDLPILLRIDSDEEDFTCSLYLDLCGRSLSHRGYRPRGHEAPLRENLAAALIMASDWDPDKDLFSDPFCGSGTLLIEAVMVKANIAPTTFQVFSTFKGYKAYAFQKQKWFQKDAKLKKEVQDIFEEIAERSRTGMANLPANQFFGSDISSKSFSVAVESFKNAHIPRDVIRLDKRDATKLSPPGLAPGVVMTNPPYGERITPEEIDALYRNFGENLKNNWKDWRAYILTMDGSLRKNISLQTSSRTPFFNGNIECRLLRYNLY